MTTEYSVLKNISTLEGVVKKIYPFDVAKTLFMCKSKAQMDEKNIKISRYM